MVTSVGVPAELKDREHRVALDPYAVALLTSDGVTVLVERGAGVGSGFADTEYQAAGAVVVNEAAEVWGTELVVKVKEPEPSEWRWFRPGLKLFAFLHLAANRDLAGVLQAGGIEAHAFETVADRGHLPLLAPMSEIAGRAAAILGAAYLGGRAGILMGGSAGVPPARVVVVGMGVAGSMAARGARGLDAEVTGVDADLRKLHDAHMAGTVTATVASSPVAVGEVVAEADVLIGAALMPGARAPIVVAGDQVASMRPGSVVIDLSIDQGGCIEASHATSLSDPVYEERGIVHYCVANIPAQFPRTATSALSAAVAPRVRQLVLGGDHPLLTGSLNVAGGRIVHPAVAAALAPPKSAA